MDAPVVTPELLRTFSPPPELSHSRPREVRLTGGGRALIVVAWLLAIVAAAAGVALHLEARRQQNAALGLEGRGRTTDAIVDRLWRKSSEGKPAFAALHFDADGVRVDAERRMQLSAWRELRLGSRVAVRYLSEDPRNFVLAGARQSRLPIWLPSLVAGVLAALAALCAAMVRQQRTLLSEGRAAPAVVTSFKKHHSSHGATHRVITYDFPLLGGGVASGKASVSKAQSVGETICVVYDPDRPGRSQPYPFSLVAPEI